MHTHRSAHILPFKTQGVSFASFVQCTKYHASSPIFLHYDCFPNKLWQLQTLSKDDIAHFWGIAAPSPQSWRGRGGSVPPQTVWVLQIWGKYVGIKRHFLKLVLLLLYKVQEIFKSKEVFLEMLSFRGIWALKKIQNPPCNWFHHIHDIKNHS